MPPRSVTARSLPGRIARPPQATRPHRVPPAWCREVEQVLIPKDALARRIRELARQIAQDFAGRDLVVVAVLSGTVLFLADLLRRLSLPLRLDFIGLSSYRSGTRPGDLVFTKDLRLEVRGRDVLLVDDILDTGQTLHCVQARLRKLKPRRLKICVLLSKTAPRLEKVRADYVGFAIPNLFVVGYGLDFAERYRNLPFIGVLRPHLYQTVLAGTPLKSSHAHNTRPAAAVAPAA